MNLYKKTGCHILLVGYLQSIPDLKMDEQGEFHTIITVIQKRTAQDEQGRLVDDEALHYQIFVSGQSALHIRQFGFPGLYLWVEGDLKSACEIIAEKISFLDFPEPNESNKTASFNSINDLCNDKNFDLSFIENGDKSNLSYLIH